MNSGNEKHCRQWFWTLLSAKEDARKSLRHSLFEVLKTLEPIKGDYTEGLVTQRGMYSFELRKTRNCVNGCCVEWFLKNVNKVDVQIQASTAGLFTVVNIYESLHNISYLLLHNIA